MRARQRSYIPGVGYIRVKAVEQVELADLTDEDARPDGFDSADALRDEIDRLYPGGLVGKGTAYRVVFEVLPPDEQKKAAAEREMKKRSIV